MNVRIVGRNLPGQQFEAHGNVHVGVQVKRDAVGLVRGDALAAAWDLEVAVVSTADRGVDFRGPAVHGTRGERFVYLTWGDVTANGSFEMFRRAKLMLNRVDPALVEEVCRRGSTLLATVEMSDGCGGPRCARVDPPALTWSLA